MADIETKNEDFEYEDSLDSDEEADRVRKMKGTGNVTVNKEEEMLQKHDEIKKIYEDSILNRLPPGNKKKNVSWLERLDITSKNKVEIVSSDITDDIQREVAFYKIALENTKAGLAKLKGMNQKMMRPSDYLVEMYKSDEIMQKVRNNLVKQQVKIQNFEERKLRRDNKKFAKKVQQIKTLEKSKEKRRNLEAINKWKQEIRQKGENAADLSDFLKKDPGRPSRGGRSKFDREAKGGPGGKGGKNRPQKGGKKKITKRPGKQSRMKNNSKGRSGGKRR